MRDNASVSAVLFTIKPSLASTFDDEVRTNTETQLGEPYFDATDLYSISFEGGSTS